MVFDGAYLKIYGRVNGVKQYRVQEWLESVLRKTVRVLTVFSDACIIEKKLCTVTTASMRSSRFLTPARYAGLRRR
jgi:hypothetical protein